MSSAGSAAAQTAGHITQLITAKYRRSALRDFAKSGVLVGVFNGMALRCG
jgi:hypothetical protein